MPGPDRGNQLWVRLPLPFRLALLLDRPVTPGDLAATIYRHFGVPTDATYTDVAGRVLNLPPNGGEPIRELA